MITKCPSPVNTKIWNGNYNDKAVKLRQITPIIVPQKLFPFLSETFSIDKITIISKMCMCEREKDRESQSRIWSVNWYTCDNV